MNKKTIVLGVAGALAVAGGGAGYAATRDSGNAGQAVINDAAQQLGVSPTALTDALKNALKHRIDAAVAAGKVTKAQGDALKARIDAGGAPLVFGGGLGHGPGAFGHFRQVDAAASYLGLTEAQLRQQVMSGKTLAQIAKAKGKSVGGLVDAMTASAKKHLDAAVTAGKLTRAQADQFLKTIEQQVTNLVNGKAPSFGPFGFAPHLKSRPFGGSGFGRFGGSEQRHRFGAPVF